MPDAPRPDWRNADAKASEASTSRPWQAKSGDTPGPKLPSRKFFRRAIILTTLLGLAIGIGFLLKYLQGTRPACLVVVGSGYEHNLLLPPNVFGWHGGLDILEKIEADEPSGLAAWFRDAFGQEAGIRRTKAVPLTGAPWPETWEQIAQRIQRGSAKEQVILYFSAHGYADTNDAYLLRDVPGIKSPEDFDASRISFAEILRSVKELDNERNVLLFLDVCHVQSHWPIGMLQNDFVERLREKYTADIEAMGNLTVICSTGPGQRSWASEERRTSIFADAVSKGLRGEGQDDSITPSSLFTYVNRTVNEWTKVNRAREQDPIQIGRGRDRELVRITGSRAKNDAKENNRAAKENPKNGEAPPGFNPGQLEEAWLTWMVLKRDYAPHVYSPHYWRLYQEKLLRYEQLVRAGDPTAKADALKEELGLLEKDIKNDKVLIKSFECLGNSFPLPRVLGYRPKSNYSNKQMEAVAQWKAKPDDQFVAALRPFVGNSKRDSQYWQTRLSRMLLRKQLVGKKDIDHVRVHEVLMEVAKSLSVPQHTAEVHLIKMLQAPAARAEPADISFAVEVRMLAEEAALGIPDDDGASELYAEAIYKFVSARIELADRDRREGEDRLFGNPSTQSKQARDKLTEAKGKYEEILAARQQLRKAMELRDTLTAELHFHAVSLALAPAVKIEIDREIEEMRTKAQSLGESLGLLTKFVDAEKDDPNGPKLRLTQIADDLNFIREHHHILCTMLLGLGADVQMSWHALDAVLAVPPSVATKEAVKLRMELLRKLQDTARTLDAGNGVARQKEPTPDTLELQQKLLRATLKPYEEQIPGAERKHVDDQVRNFFLRQFPATEKSLGDAENEAALKAAVGHSRVLLGHQADRLKDRREERINPAKLLRQLQTYQLFLGLARRTLDDHWFDPGAPKNEATYYIPVARAFLDDAGKILEPKGKLLKEQRQDLLDRLRPAGLSISGDDLRYWTTELSLRLKCKVQSEAGAPKVGLPTFWLETPSSKERDRVTIRDWPTPFDPEVELKEDDFKAAGKGPVALHAVFRGQHVTKEIKIERTPPNVIVRHTPGLDKVAFAARMDKLEYGAISIVLDTSASMLYRHPRVGANINAGEDEKSRYYYATKALEQVLQWIPEKTSLSLATFETKDKNSKTEPAFVRQTTDTADPFVPWKSGRLGNLIADVKSRNLSLNDSPIAKAITLCMDKGFPAEVDGGKLILVLTDGFDNCSYDRNEKNPDKNTKLVQQKLEEYKQKYPKIDVVIVCFIDDDEEFAQAQRQFEAIAKAIIREKEGNKLARRIEDHFIPFIQLRTKGEPAPGFELGRPVNPKGTGVLEWKPPLEPFDYKARIMKSSANDVDVRMALGHNLFATLRRERDGLTMERGIVGLQSEIKPEVRKENGLQYEKNDWLVTLLKNEEPRGVDRVSQLIAFEHLKATAGPIRQIPPGFVWLELETQDGGKIEQKVAWGNDVIVPAPAYAVDVANWPGGKAKLTAWFWPDSWEDLLRDLKPEFDKPVNIKNFQSRSGDLIESVQWESDRSVGVMKPDGKWGEMLNRCLVVRTNYVQGEPVFVYVKEKNQKDKNQVRVGSEHQFFQTAGKCTACYYGLNPNQEEFEVVVISVARFKAAAEKRGTKVVFSPREEVAVPNIFRQAIIGESRGN